MTERTRSLLRWLPRGLGVVFALFLSIFALDVFDAGYGPWETIVALVMHLLPVWYLVVVLVAAWRWPWVGSLGFITFGVWYLAAFPRGGPAVALLLAGWPIAVGLLFLLSWWGRSARRRLTRYS